MAEAERVVGRGGAVRVHRLVGVDPEIPRRAVRRWEGPNANHHRAASSTDVCPRVKSEASYAAPCHESWDLAIIREDVGAHSRARI